MRRPPTIACVAWASVVLCSAAAVPADEFSELFGAAPKVVKVAGDCSFTEGPAYSPRGVLLFSDIPNSRILRLGDNGKTSEFLKPSGAANGLAFDEKGNLYVCQGGDRQLSRIRADNGELEVLADRYDGKRLNSPNDVALDGAGGLYFTDPRYGDASSVEQDVMGVYYIGADGELTRVIEDLGRPNGVVVSPDGSELFVAVPDHGQIFRYGILGPADLTAGTLIFTGDSQKDKSGPDGMAVDERGNLYATYAGIVVLHRDGHVVGRLAIPERPANCTFGGDDNKTLYITARTSLYAVETNVSGAKLADAGPLLDDAAVAGAEEAEPKKKTETREVKAKALTLNVPTSWKQGTPTSRLRTAQFSIPAAGDDGEPAELVIFSFGGAGGGVRANLERWVKQFEAKGRKQKAVSGKATTGPYVLLDVTGTYNKPIGPPVLRKTKKTPGARMLAVILQVNEEENYFLKLTGSQATVAKTIDDFRRSFGADAKKEKPFELE